MGQNYNFVAIHHVQQCIFSIQVLEGGLNQRIESMRNTIFLQDSPTIVAINGACSWPEDNAKNPEVIKENDSGADQIWPKSVVEHGKETLHQASVGYAVRKNHGYGGGNGNRPSLAQDYEEIVKEYRDALIQTDENNRTSVL